MNRHVFTAALAGVMLSALLAAAPLGAMGQNQPMASPSSVQLHAALRKLWEEHIVYTRTYIISALAGLDDTASVADRLLRNQDDLGAAIVPFYGEEAGKKLAALLRAHILVATQIVKAAKEGDNEGVASGESLWHQNGEQIAAFLSGANPNWPKAVMSDMLAKHLDYTTAEVVSRIKGDWTADIAAYDQGHDHMLMFADMLADGIIKQFPSKVSR